jgi:hypothetical protein
MTKSKVWPMLVCQPYLKRMGYIRIMGDIWLGDIWLGDIWLGDIWLGDIWLGDIWLGDIWLGEVIFGWVIIWPGVYTGNRLATIHCYLLQYRRVIRVRGVVSRVATIPAIHRN